MSGVDGEMDDRNGLEPDVEVVVSVRDPLCLVKHTCWCFEGPATHVAQFIRHM